MEIIKDNFLVDSHCHLNMIAASEEYQQYTNKNDVYKILVEEAQTAGVRLINTICTKLDEIDELLAVTDNYKNVFCSIGVHPAEIENYDYNADHLIKYVKENPKICSIGESGLDYHYLPYDKKKQKEHFVLHIEAARQTGVPLVIHSREADEDMLDILQQEMKNGEFSFVLHCFCSGRELAFGGLDLGGYVSFSGILTFNNSKDLQELAKNVPLDKMLVETDAPFLSPVPLRGKLNKPSHVRHTAVFLANLLGLDFNNIAEQTTNNFSRLFKRTSSL